MERINGTAVWFNAAKGYGFISSDADGKEFFCHFSALQMEGFRTLNEGDEVTFEIGQGPTGKPQAAIVVLTKSATQAARG